MASETRTQLRQARGSEAKRTRSRVSRAVRERHTKAHRAQRDALIDRYHAYVEKVVSQLIRTMSFPNALRDEFMSAGYLGLVEAASRFDPSRGFDFRAFAFLRIRGAIIDYIRSSCELSGNSYRAFKALESAHDLRMESLEQPSALPKPGTGATRRSLEFLSKSLVAFRLTVVKGASSLKPGASDPDELEIQLDAKRNSEKIRRIVATLPDKERTIIEQYYFHDRKFTEVAAQHAGLSKSWVSRLHDRALVILKEKFKAEVPDLVGGRECSGETPPE